MNKNKGFTLIELLVVIAIIGILASVVLASLNTARQKGADAAIKSNLSNIRAQAEMVYDTTLNYDGLCDNANVDDQISAAATASGNLTVVKTLATAGTSGTAVCHVGASPAQAWAIAVPLKSDNANSWCVDSTGASKQITGYLAANDVTCD